MKTRKLKWQKDNDLDDPMYNCCSWFARDKQTQLEFYITYWVEDIVSGKFSVDSTVWLGTADDPFITQTKITTKWSLERFESFELKYFKYSLVEKAKKKFEMLANNVKVINV